MVSLLFLAFQAAFLDPCSPTPKYSMSTSSHPCSAFDQTHLPDAHLLSHTIHPISTSDTVFHNYWSTNSALPHPSFPIPKSLPIHLFVTVPWYVIMTCVFPHTAHARHTNLLKGLISALCQAITKMGMSSASLTPCKMISLPPCILSGHTSEPTPA